MMVDETCIAGLSPNHRMTTADLAGPGDCLFDSLVCLLGARLEWTANMEVCYKKAN